MDSMDWSLATPFSPIQRSLWTQELSYGRHSRGLGAKLQPPAWKNRAVEVTVFTGSRRLPGQTTSTGFDYRQPNGDRDELGGGTRRGGAIYPFKGLFKGKRCLEGWDYHFGHTSASTSARTEVSIGSQRRGLLSNVVVDLTQRTNTSMMTTGAGARAGAPVGGADSPLSVGRQGWAVDPRQRVVDRLLGALHHSAISVVQAGDGPLALAHQQNQQHHQQQQQLPQQQQQISCGRDDANRNLCVPIATSILTSASTTALSLHPLFCTGLPCDHMQHWKRLRAKKGQIFFVCHLCGAKWRMPTQSTLLAKLLKDPDLGMAMLESASATPGTA